MYTLCKIELKTYWFEIGYPVYIFGSSNNNFCLSLFMTTPKDFVCCACDLELFYDIGVISILQLLYFHNY